MNVILSCFIRSNNFSIFNLGSELLKKLLDEYKIKGQVFKSVGCDECDNTGYKGRLSIGEYVSIDEKISELIHNSASENEISDYVYKNNKKIYQNGLQVVANGDTSLSELMRVIED